MTNPHHQDRPPRPERPGHARARRDRRFAVVSARLSVRDVAWARHRGLGRRRQSLPRLRRRHCRVLHGTCPSKGGRCHQGGGRQVPARFERLLAREHDAPDRAPGGSRADGRARDELPLPVRHRIGRGRDQARALRDRSPAIHRLPRQLPRTHDGVAGVHLEQVHAAEGLCADDARRDARAVPQSVPAPVCGRGPGQGGARLHPHAVRAQRAGVRSRRDHDRAPAGRGRLPVAARRLPGRVARTLRRARHPADLRRSAIRSRPHRQDVGVRALGREARHHDQRQGTRLRHADRRDHRQDAGSWSNGSVAPTATRSAAIR